MSKLLDLLDGVNEWSELHSRLSSLSKPTKTGKRDGGQGKKFEKEFCKAYFKIVPQAVNEFSEVWLGDEVPTNVKKKLGIGSDHGIDLILKKKSGKLVAVQCKFEGKPENRISWSKHKLANLFADGDKADELIIFTSAGGVDKHTLSKREGDVQIIGYADLDALSPLFFDNLRSFLSGKKIKSESKTPRKYQTKAVLAAKSHFKKNNRGQLILPCGSGKTIVSIWIKDALCSKKTLILCPTLALLRQTRIEWLAAQEHFIPYICVCSEKDVDGTDGIRISIAEIGREVTTEPVEISNFLNRHDSEVLVFSTYKSSPRIAEALRINSKFQFDLAVCDEAHRTAGTGHTLAKTIHSDEQISVSKRLYMTATPRVLDDRFKVRIEEESYLADMDDIEIFGKAFFSMTFAEAIDLDILADYQILAIGVKDGEVRNAVDEKHLVESGDTVEEWAKNFALKSAMDDHELTHAISFHAKIDNAKRFASRHEKISEGVSINHVNGRQSTKEREQSLRIDFKKSPKALVTNARCLSEGVDVPEIDLVFFGDPRKSKIDIVQAVGRALRKSHRNKNKKSFIVVPLFHSSEENLEDSIAQSYFENLITVVRAIGDHDERLYEEIGLMAVKGVMGGGLGGDIDPSDPFGGIILFEGLENKIKGSLFKQFIERASRSWTVKYELLKGFLNEFERFPKDTEHYRGIHLGKWKQRQKYFYRKKTLSEGRILKLESLGISWAVYDDNWINIYDLVCEYLKENDDRFPVEDTVYEGKALGSWCQTQRGNFKANPKLISQDRIEKLDSIGFNWEPMANIFQSNLEKLLAFIEAKNRLPRLNQRRTKKEKDEHKLAEWVSNQKTRLKDLPESKERKKLETVGVEWRKLHEIVWEKQFVRIRKFKKEKGRTPKRKELFTDGKDAYTWIHNQKTKWDKLSSEIKNKLESVGILKPVDPEVGWKTNFEKLKEYVETNESFPPPEHDLYTWCRTQRASIKEDRINNKQIDLLNSIYFPWDKLEQNFLDSIYALKSFIQESERLPYTRESWKNINVGLFIRTSREAFHRGKLTKHRMEKLLELGVEFEDIATKRERIFSEKAKALGDFFKSHNKLPQQGEKWKEVEVGYFLHTQRKDLKKGKLKEERIKILEFEGIYLKK